ncbi:MAG: DUF2281 domain-containing protein [Chitinivibrionales bacterium]|nr:DUF2281 domain-containing protein [Chitinivibrionales bacterium]
MLPAKKMTEEITHTVKKLPYEKQQEVYDFVAFLKSKTMLETSIKTRNSLDELVGIIDGPADLASRHDEIYD